MKYPLEYKVPWSARGLMYTDEEVAVVTDVMKNSDVLTQGSYQKKFESEFSRYLGGGSCFAVATGTAALELAAILSELNVDDEVILPAHTFVATAIPFARTGAKLVWADIDPDTFVVTADTILPLINNKTKVIVVVHLYGLSVDMEPIEKIASQNQIILIEDAAQSLGAKINSKSSGTLGDFGCFSFHSHKNITTLGEGGAIWIKDPALAAKVPGLRHNGLRPFPEPRDKYWVPAMSNLDFDIDGFWPYNFCISEVQCALASKLLCRLDSINAERAARYLRITQALADVTELRFQKIDRHDRSSFHLLPARFCHPHASRDDFIELLAKKYLVKCVVQYCPLYRYPMFQKAGFGEASCPVSDSFFDHMISIPFQHWMTFEQENYLIDSFRQAIITIRKGY